MQNFLPMKEPKTENEQVRPILTISKALCFKDEMEDGAINIFLNNPNSIYDLTHELFKSAMS